MSQNELVERLAKAWPGLEREQMGRIERYYDLLVAENEIQNLTRLISPEDFVEGHVLDVKELINSSMVDFPAMDLGSGGGVPGLLSALIRPDAWILVDSEGKKADFLRRAAETLGLHHVQVFGMRAEDVLKTVPVKSVVARAVGPVERIYGWLGKSSTWNNLVLLKGPSWEEEWATFEGGIHKKKLFLGGDRFYEVGAEKKRRRIVKLTRKRL